MTLAADADSMYLRSCVFVRARVLVFVSKCVCVCVGGRASVCVCVYTTASVSSQYKGMSMHVLGTQHAVSVAVPPRRTLARRHSRCQHSRAPRAHLASTIRLPCVYARGGDVGE